MSGPAIAVFARFWHPNCPYPGEDCLRLREVSPKQTTARGQVSRSFGDRTVATEARFCPISTTETSVPAILAKSFVVSDLWRGVNYRNQKEDFRRECPRDGSSLRYGR